MRSLVATALAALLAVLTITPAAAARQPDEQTPEIKPFQSAHFDLAGIVKVDGISVDVLGEGDLAPPDRQRASFKFGPFTAEVIMIGDAVYTRTRFERRWSRQLNPQTAAIGPFSASELIKIEGDVKLVGREVLNGVPTEHYSTTLNFQNLVEPLLPVIDDDDAREAFRTLKGTVDIWVGALDRMIRQERLVIVVTLPSFEPEGDPVPGTVDLTIAYSELNQPVAIEQPIRNDPSPLRSPQPNVTPLSGQVTTPPPTAPRTPSPAPAPVQVPRR